MSGGHRLQRRVPTPSGWRARCSCGHVSRGINEQHALERHDEHAATARAAAHAPIKAGHAKARARVRLPNGQTGELVYVPIPWSIRRTDTTSKGQRARVRLKPGLFASVDVAHLTLVEPETVA